MAARVSTKIADEPFVVRFIAKPAVLARIDRLLNVTGAENRSEVIRQPACAYVDILAAAWQLYCVKLASGGINVTRCGSPA